MALLLDQGADINAQDSQGYTPLHYAIKKRHIRDNLPAIRYLLEHNAETELGCRTAFLEAMNCMNIRAAQVLLEHGADPFAKDTISKRGALHYVAINYPVGEFELFRQFTTMLIRKLGLDVNQCDSELRTPLHDAAENNAVIVSGFSNFYV